MRAPIFAFLLCLSFGACAQTPQYFSIPRPQAPAPASRFGHLLFQDIRPDTTDLGRVVESLMNFHETVLPRPSLDTQLRQVLQVLRDGRGGDTLLFQLRAFQFVEQPARLFGSRGWCFLRASLYAADANGFAPLATLDTVLLVEGKNASPVLQRDAAALLTSFLQAHLADASPAEHYAAQTLRSIDSIEKARLPLYAAKDLKPGLYYTYAALRDQQPDVPLASLHFRGDRLKYVTIPNGGKDELVEDYYAVVSRNKIYVPGLLECYEVYRKGADLCYRGSVKLRATALQVGVGHLAFGLAGALLAGLPENRTVEFLIDHRTGAPVLPSQLQRTGRVGNVY